MADIRVLRLPVSPSLGPPRDIVPEDAFSVRSRTIATIERAVELVTDDGMISRSMLRRVIRSIAHHLSNEGVQFRIYTDKRNDAAQRYRAMRIIEIQPSTATYLNRFAAGMAKNYDGLRLEFCAENYLREGMSGSYWNIDGRHGIELPLAVILNPHSFNRFLQTTLRHEAGHAALTMKLKAGREDPFYGDFTPLKGKFPPLFGSSLYSEYVGADESREWAKDQHHESGYGERYAKRVSPSALAQSFCNSETCAGVAVALACHLGNCFAAAERAVCSGTKVRFAGPSRGAPVVAALFRFSVNETKIRAVIPLVRSTNRAGESNRELLLNQLRKGFEAQHTVCLEQCATLLGVPVQEIEPQVPEILRGRVYQPDRPINALWRILRRPYRQAEAVIARCHQGILSQAEAGNDHDLPPLPTISDPLVRSTQRW